MAKPNDSHADTYNPVTNEEKRKPIPLTMAGEYGFYMISDGSEYPWRAKMRSPSLINLQILPELLRGHRMSDAIAILGSIDIILGCVDR